jgi:hypothetical protein
MQTSGHQSRECLDWCMARMTFKSCPKPTISSPSRKPNCGTHCPPLVHFQYTAGAVGRRLLCNLPRGAC